MIFENPTFKEHLFIHSIREEYLSAKGEFLPSCLLLNRVYEELKNGLEAGTLTAYYANELRGLLRLAENNLSLHVEELIIKMEGEVLPKTNAI